MDVFSSYEVKIGGSTKITTRIADTPELVTCYLEELTTLIIDYKAEMELATLTSDYKAEIKPGQPKRAIVVGFDAYFDSYTHKVATLQFCFGAHCLIIQLIHSQLDSTQLAKLEGFFIHLDINFVGVGIRNTVDRLQKQHGVACKKVIELGPLADRVYRKTEYFSSKLEKLALEIVGIDIKRPRSLDSIKFINWGARDLTSEQIEYSTICAYASYAVANKLLNA